MPNRRKPFVVKEAEGNRGHRPLNPPAYAPAGDFDPPFDLSDVARAEWDRIRPEATWIKATDAAALAMRCELFAEIRELKADIAVEGWATRGARGDVRNPKSSCLKDARSQLTRLDVELGLTSMSRERITAPAEDAVDPEDAAMFA